MRYLVSIATFGLLAGCASPNSDFEKGPVILQCDGETTSVIMGAASTKKDRRHYNIDAKRKTLRVFNGKKFVAWGEGEPEVGPNQITFDAKDVGVGIYAIRNIAIDRASGQVTDTISLSVGGGSKFEGECKPVSEPESVANKF